MALPTTIASTKFPGANYYDGPFLSSGGNVYVVVLDTTNSKIHVYKATDPTASFTEQDSANVPAQTLANTTNSVLWALQNGDVLSIAAGDGTTTPAYKFHQFSMATDSWSTIKDKAILSPTLGVNTSASISIVKRSDNSFVALLNGAIEKAMGANYDRVSYVRSTDGGATWSAETAVGVTGLKRNIYGSSAIIGASDRGHFFYADTTLNMKHRSLSSAGSLDTEAVVTGGTTDYALRHNFPPGVAYQSGADIIVMSPVTPTENTVRLTNVRFTSAANPTIATDATYTDAGVNAQNGGWSACHALDGTTVHSVWSHTTLADLMHDSHTNGGSWGTDVNEWTALLLRVSANIYTRAGSKVLAVLVDDGGTVKYNEISLSSDQSYAVSGVFATG